MKKILITANLVCVFMHILFGLSILENRSDIYLFMSVENSITTFTYLLVSYLICCSEKQKKALFINLIFWSFFEINVLFFKPNVTTLYVIEKHLPQLQQWIVLSIYGGILIFLTTLEIAKTYNLGILTPKRVKR
ncbi:hypothetical protein TFUB4_02601 [Tannerella forsythia]|jgi:hypothetical protein|uniref:Uncharacterized protein n=2 Tax=Bacteroidales TaxID=171549 RepID=A0A1D3UU70_TANFO|nr:MULTISPECIES: hypothetical protein [Bacteroidales]AKV63706.1 hypothetical protein PGA7_00004720 [Porphyromonas gingivalis]AUR47017.1 hypothetical protein CF003_n32 [Porphyromonas gingivalis]KGN92780.1 hypothetical protein HR15_01935 [Porphyromonas gulae]PDP69735.1 hypothetical protein CLI85_13035 [Tannerella forsythia]RRD56900.1 hypothetical protein EII40_13410 [Tannerella forsythia]